MTDRYFRNLNRIEFSVTLACTGRCRHCSEGGSFGSGEHIDAGTAVDAVKKICERYNIESVMTFGGEPLLFPETVGAIQGAAASLDVAVRQVITNGFFSRDPEKSAAVARALADCGVNDLLLSVDAFHQETIPLEPVLFFARCALDAGIPTVLSPAWLRGPQGDNKYDRRTREVLREFEPLGIPVDAGNVVFPMGNALIYLREYFPEDVTPSSPYEDDPEDIRAVSFLPNGDVLNGNVYKTDILEIMRAYRPS